MCADAAIDYSYFSSSYNIASVSLTIQYFDGKSRVASLIYADSYSRIQLNGDKSIFGVFSISMLLTLKWYIFALPTICCCVCVLRLHFKMFVQVLAITFNSNWEQRNMNRTCVQQCSLHV